MVIGLACVTGFYFFSSTLPAHTNTTTASGTTVVINNPATAKQNQQLLLSAASEHLNNRQLNKAEDILDRLFALNNSDPRLDQLRSKATRLRTYIDLLDKGELALARNDIPELQHSVASATKFGFTDKRLQTLTISLLNARERADIDSANKSLVKNRFKLHVANAEHHLATGDFALAAAAIDKARLLGIGDDNLDHLENQINEQRLFDSTPMSQVEFEFASSQFRQLAKAIKLRNISAVTSLTSGNTDKQELFTSLFSQYIEIKANVTNLSTNDNNKIVSATLQLDNMRLPNGNLIYPPSSYGEISLYMQHTRQGWSKIQW